MRKSGFSNHFITFIETNRGKIGSCDLASMEREVL